MPGDLFLGVWNRRLIGAVLMIVSTGLVAHPCFAQGKQQQPQVQLQLGLATVAGKVDSISGDTIVVSTIGGLKSPVTVSNKKLQELMSRTQPPQKKELSISVKGSADVEYLSTKGIKYVTFSAEMTGGKAKGEIKELTLFTPDETHQTGITNSAPSLEGGDSEAAPGNFLVSGQIKSLKNGVLTVTAPNERGKQQSVMVKLAPKVKVSVQATSMQFVQPGDTIEAKGITLSQNGQSLPGFLAESVTVTLAKTLSGKKGKRPAANDKNDKPAEAEAAAEAKPEAKPVAKPVENKPAEPKKSVVEAKEPAREKAPPAKPAAGRSGSGGFFDGPSEAPAAAGTDDADGQPDAQLVITDAFSVDQPEPATKKNADKAAGKSR